MVCVRFRSAFHGLSQIDPKVDPDDPAPAARLLALYTRRVESLRVFRDGMLDIKFSAGLSVTAPLSEHYEAWQLVEHTRSVVLFFSLTACQEPITIATGRSPAAPPSGRTEVVTMSPVSNPVDILLLPLDPTRGLRRLSEDLSRVAELDPKVRAASKSLEERFATLTSAEQDAVVTAFWVYVRGRLTRSGGLEGFRRFIGDGERFLRLVEAALDSLFSLPTLKQAAAQLNQLAVADSPASAEIEQARDELRQLSTTDSLVVVVALATYGALVLYHVVVAEDYTLTSSPPPPPPPPPDENGGG